MNHEKDIEVIIEAHRKEFPDYHQGCDDGFYACPKSEDYFGHYGEMQISERPCHCGVPKALEKQRDFLRTSLLTIQQSFLERAKKCVPEEKGVFTGDHSIDAQNHVWNACREATLSRLSSEFANEK